jgi:putative membrane protein
VALKELVQQGGEDVRYSLTRAGRAAYDSHVPALRALLDDPVEVEGRQSAGAGTSRERVVMRRERVLRDAEFTPNVIRYYVLASSAALALTVVGIPLILIVAPIVYVYYTRYYARLRVRLTTRELKVTRGILVVEEKSIPLEKITDLAVYQGPVMRAMDLKGIKVETAGQTSQGTALVSIVGIVDTDGFRDMVLEQRDRIADRDDTPPETGDPAQLAGSGLPAGDPALLSTLMEIRDLLRRIEQSVSREDRAE